MITTVSISYSFELIYQETRRNSLSQLLIIYVSFETQKEKQKNRNRRQTSAMLCIPRGPTEQDHLHFHMQITQLKHSITTQYKLWQLAVAVVRVFFNQITLSHFEEVVNKTSPSRVVLAIRTSGKYPTSTTPLDMHVYIFGYRSQRMYTN